MTLHKLRSFVPVHTIDRNLGGPSFSSRTPSLFPSFTFNLFL